MAMQNNTIEAVIFDMDGVLVNGEDLWHEGDGRFLERRGLKPLPEYFDAFMGKSNEDVAETMMKDFQLDEKLDAIIKERKGIIAGLYHEKVEPIDGAVELVGFAKNSGYKTALGS